MDNLVNLLTYKIQSSYKRDYKGKYTTYKANLHTKKGPLLDRSKIQKRLASKSIFNMIGIFYLSI